MPRAEVGGRPSVMYSAARAAEADGNLFPGLTLQLGIAYHQAIDDVCADFERRFAASGTP